MSPDTSSQTRKIVVALVLIAAVLMIAVVPFVTDRMLNPIIQGQLARIEKFSSLGTPEGNAQAAVIKIIPWSIGFLFPFLTALTFIAGFVLLAVAKPLYEGETWARGAALTALALPSIAGAFQLVPWMNFVGSVQGGMPPAIITMAIGLIPYFAIILAEKSSLVYKAANALVFLMLGVTAAENFANAHAAFRIYYGHPKRPLFTGETSVLWLAFPVLWVTSFMLIVAIHNLGQRKASGMYLALGAGGATFAASLATHYVRHATNDYLYGALMGLSIVVLLVIPAVKQAVLSAPGKEKPVEKPVVQARTA